MALCLANSLVVHGNFIPYDQLVRYKWWYRYGYMSSTGECFDIGAATKQSIEEFERRQEDFKRKFEIPPEHIDTISDEEYLQEFSVYCSQEEVAGNGALMRLAPVPLFFYRFPAYAVEYSGQSGQFTHGDTKAYDACRYYAALIVAALYGYKKEQLLDRKFYAKHRQWFGSKPLCPEIAQISEGSYKRNGYEEGIRGKGYIVNALEAALWAFWSDDNSFEKGALAAVNLGDDTDTTAAIYGQLAGAYYGLKKLPRQWLKHVYAKKFILNLSGWIYYEGLVWQPLENALSNISSSCPQLPPNDITTHSPKLNSKSSPDQTAVAKSDSPEVKEDIKTEKQQNNPKLRPVASDGSYGPVAPWRPLAMDEESSKQLDADLTSNHQLSVKPPKKSSPNKSSMTLRTSTRSPVPSPYDSEMPSPNNQEDIPVFPAEKLTSEEPSVYSWPRRKSQLASIPNRKKLSSTTNTTVSRSNGEISIKKTSSFSSAALPSLSCNRSAKLLKCGSTYQEPINVDSRKISDGLLLSKTASPPLPVRTHRLKPTGDYRTDTAIVHEDSRIAKKPTKSLRSLSTSKAIDEQRSPPEFVQTTRPPLYRVDGRYADRWPEQNSK